MILQKRFYPRLKEISGGALIAIVLVCGFLALWLPDILAHTVYQGEDNDRFNKLVDDYRLSILVTISATAIVYALGLARKVHQAAEQRLVTEQKALEFARRNEMTERLMKALSYLNESDSSGRKLIETRLGGIYALERIAADSPEDHWTIMQILGAYVRQNSREGRSHPPARLDVDIQAALTVFGRRQHKLDGARLDLSDARLAGADMRSAHFEEASFERASLQLAGMQEIHLEGAILVGADLEGCLLTDASLEGAQMAGANLNSAIAHRSRFQRADLSDAWLQQALLTGVHMENADLTRARLEGAKLSGAHLEQSNLTDASLGQTDLTRAFLQGANLASVLELTQEQLDSAYGDGTTQLPVGLVYPAHWFSSLPDTSPHLSSRLMSNR
jgi:uncharacterized protein YjbI with pentapeptide repeats